MQQTGKQICVYCGKEFSWYMTVREYSDMMGNFTVTCHPQNSVHAFVEYSVETREEILQAKCPFCNKFNIIDKN